MYTLKIHFYRKYIKDKTLHTIVIILYIYILFNEKKYAFKLILSFMKTQCI